MITCKKCNSEISKTDKHCPSCGEKVSKKPLYKKWWFWTLIAVLLIGCIGSATEEPSANSSETSIEATGTTEPEINLVELCKQQVAQLSNINPNAVDVFIKYVPNFETDFVSIERAKGNCEFKLTLKDTTYTVVTFVNSENHVAAIISPDHNRLYDATIKDGVIINRTDCNHEYGEPTYVEASYTSVGKEVIICSICGSRSETITGNKISPVSFCVETYDIDFLGGITLHTNIRNNTDKDIKYVHFTLQLFNAVNDVIYSDFHNTASDGSMSWTLTGPLQPEQSTTLSCTGFYNNTFKGSYRLVSYTVIFMDGTQITIDDSTIGDYDKVFSD